MHIIHDLDASPTTASSAHREAVGMPKARMYLDLLSPGHVSCTLRIHIPGWDREKSRETWESSESHQDLWSMLAAELCVGE